MRKALVAALVSLLVLSAVFVLVAVHAAAEGSESGDFPFRTFLVTRSPPGGPRSDTFKPTIAPTASGMWSVRAEVIAGAAVIVQVYKMDGGVLVLEGSSKLRAAGQESTPVALVGGATYQAWFTPFGKAGTSTLTEIYRINERPIAAFTFSPLDPVAGETINFDGSTSSDPDGMVVSYAWDFGDGSTATGVRASHVYASAGTKTVTLIVKDDGGAADDEIKDIVVAENPAPIAVIAFRPAAPLSGDLVSFDGSGSSDPGPPRDMIVSYAWNFGDGSLGSGAMVTHAYARPGTYTVTLTVTDSFGATGSATASVPVANRAPTAVLSVAPLSALTFELITADGSGSSDSDGTIVSYVIDWGDGTPAVPGPIATHEYADGTNLGKMYTITLTVTDDLGAPDTDSRMVTIMNRNPVAVLRVSPLSGEPGVTTFTADGSGSTDRDGTIALYMINWGDGSPAVPGPTATHIYATANTYTITLTVTDDDGAAGTATATVLVARAEDRLPTAVLAVMPLDALTFVMITADGSGSTDDKGITAYSISWGDGSPASAGPIATHEYTDGTKQYTITLTVTDTIGQTGTATAIVTIRNRSPTAAFSFTPIMPLSGDPVMFDARASSDRDGSIVTYAWLFGDGGTGVGATPTHAYASPGPYTVTLTVTDDDGATGMASMSITVEDRAPVPRLTVNPTSALTFVAITADGRASSDPDSTIVSYRIDWGDGSPAATTSLATHEYADGTVVGKAYTIRLTVTDDFGKSAFTEASVTILNRPPTAALSVTPPTVFTFEAVTADATGSSDRDGRIMSYSIDWGDGSPTSALSRDTHEYRDNLVYTVRVTVTDDDGATASATAPVTVNNRAPTAALSVLPATVNTGDLVTADASGSSDRDGLITAYRIDWGDGSPAATTAVATHAYADGTVAGKLYTVTLTVTDDDGATASATAPVTVNNRAPTAALSVLPATVNTGDLVTADASGSSDRDGLITAYRIDWGDGSPAATTAVATHAYADGTVAGKLYTVTLTVTDDDGATNTAVQTVKVFNRAPTAILTVTPPSGEAGKTQFTADGSGSSDSDGTIASYSIDWGDGSPASPGPTATHIYPIAGTYTVTLTVTDDDGATATATASVTVTPPPPLPTGTTWRYFDFFAEPYHEWWDFRTFFSDDRAIGAECFSADGIVARACFPFDPGIADTSSFPYTNWDRTPIGDFAIYAPYRFEAVVPSDPAYTIDVPVIVPTCTDLATTAAALVPSLSYTCPTPPPAGGTLSIQQNMNYLTTARMLALEGPARGCPSVLAANDGFLMEVQLTLTMDSAAAAKLFGVTDPAMWTPGLSEAALIAAGCGTGGRLDAESGKLEKAYKAWVEKVANGPYDVFNAFGAPAQLFGIEALGSFDAVSGKHTLTVTLIGWGYEVLTARWFYWGSTSYRDGVLAGVARKGWWGMEVPWFEDFRMTATIDTDFSATTITGVQQYHFQALADIGGDGIWFTADDVAKWVWQPVLGDRFPTSGAHPASELGTYIGLKYIHATPGTLRYGTSFDYDYVPHVWALASGQGQTFHLPTVNVVLIDPRSPKTGDPLSLILVSSAIGFKYSVPASGVGTYNAVTKVLTVTGPTTPGTPPLNAAGKPLESRPIYNFGA